jgi:hypothetical protein
MARQDTFAGLYNYTVKTADYAAITESALQAPSATSVYPGYPSPAIPLSNQVISGTTYPTVLWQGVSADVAGGELDGHPFEVVVAGTATGAATCTLTVKLYQAAYSVVSSAVNSTAYGYMTAHGPSGTGVNQIVSASSIALGSSAKTNFILKAPLIWDSTSKTLNYAYAPSAYAIGASLSATTGTASSTSIGQTDLNFFPTFTWGTAFGGSLVITEFVINRL